MAEENSTRSNDFPRYAQLIEAALAAAPLFSAQAEDADAIQIERGLLFPRLLHDKTADVAALAQRLIVAAETGHAAAVRVVDRLGHGRAVYKPLLLYAWARAYGLAYETLETTQFGKWEEALRAWAEAAQMRLSQLPLPGSEAAPTAAQGNLVVEACWTALALYAAGKVLVREVWGDLASDVFGRLPHWQNTDGAFLAAAPADNPDIRAYDELAILHAAASYAVQSEDRPLWAVVVRSTLFGQQQIQADHATGQPWALLAFVCHPSTHASADVLLHAFTLQAAQNAAPDAVSLMLLADALYCLRLFRV